MPPTRRARGRGKKRAAVELEPLLGSGWQSMLWSKRPKRAAAGDDDGQVGLLLPYEILLAVFSFLPDAADLVRCAGTCRLWRRMVSSEAELLCRSAPRSARFARPLAVGFFQQRRERGGTYAPPRFFPLDPRFQQASLDKLFDGELFKSARLLASRKGHLAFELRRISRATVLRLAVCNPMTGEVSILPTLSGKDKPGWYVCALLAGDDLHSTTGGGNRPPRSGSSSSFQVVLLYQRRGFMASRSYSSDTGTWAAAEEKVTGDKISGKSLHSMMNNSVTIIGGGDVFWQWGRKFFLFRPRAGTLQTMIQASNTLSVYGDHPAVARPDGRLCSLHPVCRKGEPIHVMVAFWNDGADMLSGWQRWSSAPDAINLTSLLPSGTSCPWLLGVWETSGVVVFLTSLFQNRQAYVLDMNKKDVEAVQLMTGLNVVWDNGSGSFISYEMDWATYLKSLG